MSRTRSEPNSASFLAACLQFTPGNELDKNLYEISRLVAAAADDGAQLIALPEFATHLDRSSRSMRASATSVGDSEALRRLRQLASGHRVWLLVGSLVILAEDDPEARLRNRSFLISPRGDVAASYDKLHLFDAQMSDGRRVGEARYYRGGDRAVVVRTPLASIGLSICYDLRFPGLYRCLAQGGAEILSIPSAFTAETGAAHWEPLLRARAIETGCFVLAPATCGTHPGDWRTYGHAAIVDPWGQVLAGCGTESGVYCLARIDPEDCRKARARIPSLTTNPAFSLTLLSYPEAT